MGKAELKLSSMVFLHASILSGWRCCWVIDRKRF